MFSLFPCSFHVVAVAVSELYYQLLSDWFYLQTHVFSFSLPFSCCGSGLKWALINLQTHINCFSLSGLCELYLTSKFSFSLLLICCSSSRERALLSALFVWFYLQTHVLSFSCSFHDAAVALSKLYSTSKPTLSAIHCPVYVSFINSFICLVLPPNPYFFFFLALFMLWQWS